MSPKHLVRLNSALLLLYYTSWYYNVNVANFKSACRAFSFQNHFLRTQPLRRPHQHKRTSCINHNRSTLHCQADSICDSDRVSNNKNSYSKRVAVLLPKRSSEPIDDGETNNNWQNEAIKHLQQIAAKSKLSVVSLNEQSNKIITSYSHILMAVPCERTSTYAIALHANPQLPKKKSREKKQTKLKLDPFFVDLCPSSDTRLGYRMQLTSNKGGGELLLKALGMKKMLSGDKQQLVIYDLTAGLARDTMIMLSSIISDVEGSRMQRLRLHMMERDPIVASLLKDAMRRLNILAQNENNTEGGIIAKHLEKCLSMEEGDALSVLEKMATSSQPTESVPYPPDILYLDPMFPPRKKKASAVKKDMAMLHSLLGTATTIEDKGEKDDAEKVRLEEEQKLLGAAYNAASRRVVVKRPLNALPLAVFEEGDDDDVPLPSYDIRGNINRWDIYITSS